MEQDSLFAGHALVKTNGRHLRIPEFMERTLACLGTGVPLMIGMHEVQPCLILFPGPHLRSIHEELDRRRAQQSKSDWLEAHCRRLHRVFGLIQEGTDDQGRVVIPALLRRLGRIEDRALFVGVGPTVEIWNLDRAMALADPALGEMVAGRDVAA